MINLKLEAHYINTNSKRSKYSNKFLIDKYNVNIDHGFVIQGCTTFNDLILLSAYDDVGDNKSKIYIIKDKNIIHSCNLDSSAHSGGVAIDEQNKMLWVSDYTGTVSGYKLDDILNNSSAIPKYKRIFVAENLINLYGKPAASYITIYNNKLYVGNFARKENSMINIFNIKKDGSIDITKYDVIKSDAFTQGLYINDSYVITSISWGYMNTSRLNIYENKTNEFIDNLKKSYKMPRMMEQICIKDNKLITVFESNSSKIRYITDCKDIRIFDIDTLVN